MQLIGWILVFAGLILFNEIGRRTKIGGMIVFVIIPVILTVYFIAIQAGAFGGLSNPTRAYMNGWFHYFKLYAADIGCVGFMMIKYKWGLGKKEWFKWWPWFIVSANIMIANVSDLESAFAARGSSIAPSRQDAILIPTMYLKEQEISKKQWQELRDKVITASQFILIEDCNMGQK